MTQKLLPLEKNVYRLQETLATLCAWLAGFLGEDSASELIDSIYKDTRINNPKVVKRAKKRK